MRCLIVPVVLVCGACATARTTSPPPPDRSGPVSVLQAAQMSPDPLARANAIEGLLPDEAAHGQAIKFGLVDPNEGVRFVAAVSLGDAQRCDLIDLVRPLMHDQSPSVRAAAMYVMARCDQSPDLGALAPMVLGDDPVSRANAAMVLGKLGNPSAAGLLRASLARPLEQLDARQQRLVELTIAEALVRMGERSHLEEIRAAFFGSADDAELIAVAAQLAGVLGDTGLGHGLEQMAFDSGPRKVGLELRLIAVAALGALSPEAAQPEIAILFVDNAEPHIRAQAATALVQGDLPGQDQALAALMADTNTHVRIAAAKALLQRRSSRPLPIDEMASRP